jgi:hypothetical protein
MNGENIADGATGGAIGWAAGSAADMIAGHVVGLWESGHSPRYNENDGMWVYEAPGMKGGWFGGSALTIGNVVTGDPLTLYGEYARLGPGKYSTKRIYNHEATHAYQEGVLSEPGYAVGVGGSLVVGGTIGWAASGFTGAGWDYGTHAYNVFERGWTNVPDW